MTASLALACLLQTASQSLKGEVWVDLNQTPRAISPLMYGHNLEGGDGKGIFGKEHTNNTVTGEGFWDKSLGQPTSEGLRALLEVGATLLRYPGGCLGHGYKWKEMVGPLEDRPQNPFGLMEFMQLCEIAGVEPLMTVPDYAATPQDVEDLAQFLLAAPNSANPWAMKRYEWGHPEPYKVKRFELGNETDHGNHDLLPKKIWTAEDYSVWALDCLKRIKKVSPTAIVGPHLGTSFPNQEDPWNDVVLKRLGSVADFLVIHPYGMAVFNPASPEKLDVSKMMQACMAQGEQFEAALVRYKEKIKQVTGRAIPLYATEFNAMFVQEQPKPLRYSLGGAIFAADFLRIMMNPDSGVQAANYWQLLNGYWGMVEERQPGRPRSQAALPLFRLWKDGFGPLWLETRTEGPTGDFMGAPPATTRAAFGKASVMSEEAKAASLFRTSQMVEAAGVKIRPDGSARLEFKGLNSELHLPLATVPGQLGAAYRITFEARSGGASGSGAAKGGRIGLSAIDSRGWDKSPSGVAAEGVESASEWRTFTTLFETLPDCPGVALAWRVIPGSSDYSGWMEVRGISVKPVHLPHFPAYQLLTSAASLTKDGRTLFVMLFNKSLDKGMTVSAHVGARAKSFLLRQATGPSADSINLTSEEVKMKVAAAPAAIKGGVAEVLLPPCSMTSLEVSLSPGS